MKTVGEQKIVIAQQGDANGGCHDLDKSLQEEEKEKKLARIKSDEHQSQLEKARWNWHEIVLTVKMLMVNNISWKNNNKQYPLKKL